MKIIGIALILTLSCSLVAQQRTPMIMELPQQRDLGKWWKNSGVVEKLQLKATQIAQIEQIFLNHQKGLASANEELKSRETQLRTLMQAERIKDTPARQAIEQVATARANLEKANASMMLAIRKTLSREQWKGLESIQSQKILVASTPSASKVPGGLKSMEMKGEEPYKIGDRVSPPQIVSQPKPLYTQKAREAKIEGVVVVSAVVQKNGAVSQIKVLKGLGYGLDESVINTLSREWKFKPATLGDKPVDVSVVMEVSFRLY